MKTGILLALLLSCNAFASGKFTLQPSYDLDSKEWKPTIGLGIYEWLIGKGVAYNSWTGYGEQDFTLKEDTKWWTTTNSLDLHLPLGVTLSPGFKLSYVLPYKEFHKSVHVKLAYQLW